MDDSSLLIWLLVFLVIVFNGLLAAAEVGIISLRKSRLMYLAEGDKRARIISQLLEKPENFFASLQVWVTLLSVVGGSLATLISIKLFKPIFGPGSEEKAALCGSLIMTLLLVIFGELVPKNLALRKAEAFSLFSARFIKFLYLSAYPIFRPLAIVSGWIARLLGGEKEERMSSITEEEIQILLEEGSKEGNIEEEEKEMIASIFDFTDTTAREIMVPRIDVVGVDAEDSVEKVLEVVSKSGFSRLPVYRDNMDNIIGIVHAKDAIRRYREGKRTTPAKRIARPAYFVPESKKIDELLKEMQRNRTQMAIVVDEYGGTAGIVTLEDILEEIVGEIKDEYDRERELIERLDEKTAIVDGRVLIEDVNEELGLSLSDEEADTIGGLVYALLGKVPEEGESVELDSVRLTVEKTDGKRITRVRITKKENIEEEHS
ncbi:MAG: hemolysin family protein [bacterium]